MASGDLRNTAATTPASNVQIRLLNAADLSRIDLSKASGLAQGSASTAITGNAGDAELLRPVHRPRRVPRPAPVATERPLHDAVPVSPSSAGAAWPRPRSAPPGRPFQVYP